MKELWERNETMFQNIQFYHGHIQALDIIGKPYLMTDTPLKYTGGDQRLFHLFGIGSDSPIKKTTTLTKLGGDNIYHSSEPILSSSQCLEMVSRLEDLDNKIGLVCHETYRKTAIIHDKPFVDMLWGSMETDFKRQNTEFTMLGFDALRGQWVPSGLHHGLTLHKHDQNWPGTGLKGPQLEAQFCPDTDRRSLYTCLIFLNDHFDGDQLKFYIPDSSKGCDIDRRNKSNEQFINEYKLSSNANGLQEVLYNPKAGDAVLIKQDTVYQHLNLIARGASTKKWFLKCDLMFDRTGDAEFQWPIPESEKDFHDLCVRRFCATQQEEFTNQNRSCLAAGKEVSDPYAGDVPNEKVMDRLVECCLNTRYSYPRISQPDCDAQSKLKPNCDEPAKDPLGEKDMTFTLPEHFWLEVFEQLPANDCRNLTKAFPEFGSIYRRMLKRSPFIPELCHHNGVSTEFTFKNLKVIEQNLEKAALTSTIYSIILLGNVDRESHYLVLFRPKLKTAEEITLEEVLHCIFTDSPLPDGDIFLVRQQDASKRKPLLDLFYSVDRRFMCTNYHMEFFGIDVQSERRCCFEISKAYDDVDLSCYDDPGSKFDKHLLYKDRDRDTQIKCVQRMFTEWDNCFRLFKNEKDRTGESLEKKHHEFSAGLTPKDTLLAIQRLQIFCRSSNHDNDEKFLAFPFEFVERNRGIKKNCPSAVVVRKLDNCTVVKRSDNCVCYGFEEISWKLSNNCSTYVFNRFILRNGLLGRYEVEEDYSWPNPYSSSSESESSDDDDDDDEGGEGNDNTVRKSPKFDGFSYCQIYGDRCHNRLLLMERVRAAYPGKEDEDLEVSHFLVNLPGIEDKDDEPQGSWFNRLNREPMNTIEDPCDFCFPLDFKITDYADITSYPAIGHIHVAIVREETLHRVFTSFGKMLALHSNEKSTNHYHR